MSALHWDSSSSCNPSNVPNDCVYAAALEILVNNNITGLPVLNDDDRLVCLFFGANPSRFYFALSQSPTHYNPMASNVATAPALPPEPALPPNTNLTPKKVEHLP